jgi:hypothetical protein
MFWHKKLAQHADTWIEEDRLGAEYPEYRPTHTFRGPYIDAAHAAIAAYPRKGVIIDAGIPGWLRPADALKLYEMCYFARGDVLELGAYHGLSTSIAARALRNAGRGRRRIVSLELDAEAAAEATRNTAEWDDLRTIVLGDARDACRALMEERRRFAFAFVDHSHNYELVHAACLDLKTLLAPDGFALFHDFNDARNGRDPDYGVWHAVRDAFSDGSFAFFGVYGCTGLWRRVRS